MRVAVLHLSHQRCHQARSAAAERMSQRYRAAVDVDRVLIQSEQPDARERLRCECFVQLDDLHLVRSEARLVERFEG